MSARPEIAPGNCLDAADVAAAVAFYRVHAGVGGADDGMERGSVLRSSRQSHAGADGQIESGLHPETGGLQRPMQRGRLLHGSIGTGRRHHDDEFVAAIAEAKVLLAAQVLQTLAGSGEKLAADEVSVYVIHHLELIEIDERQAGGVPGNHAT